MAMPLSILIVEDNADARATLELILEMEGHRVTGVETGGEAVRRADAPLDVALVDLGLPDVDGYEVARRLRTTVHGRAAFLVALTGYGEPEHRQRTKEAGFDAHLVKPIDPDDLVKLLAERG
jgi:CheY-like chemotaxis protein